MDAASLPLPVWLAVLSGLWMLLGPGAGRGLWAPALLLGLGLLLHLGRYHPLPPGEAGLVLRPGGRLSVIGHRGGGFEAPENTLSAIRTAAKNKATGVELDVEFTADGVPILMHDDNVDRTTNGTGPLDRWSFEEIRKLNPAAKHRLHKIFPNEKIPTLKEAIMECLKYNLTIFFDVKGHASQSSEALKTMYREFPELYRRSIVCSFEPMVIIQMRHADQNVVTALTHRPWRLSHARSGKPYFYGFWHYWFQLLDFIIDWSLHTFLWRLCGISAFLMEKSYISMNYVQQWSNRGVEVVAWSVNDLYEKCYYENILNCTYITDTLQEQCQPRNITIENSTVV